VYRRSAAAVMFRPLSAIASRYLSCCNFIQQSASGQDGLIRRPAFLTIVALGPPKIRTRRFVSKNRRRFRCKNETYNRRKYPVKPMFCPVTTQLRSREVRSCCTPAHRQCKHPIRPRNISMMQPIRYRCGRSHNWLQNRPTRRRSQSFAGETNCMRNDQYSKNA
jgi:hypothetical protein